MSGPAIQAAGLTKVYRGGAVAVNDVSFAVEEGEIFGLVGPNGAGKTTLLSLLSTLLLPTSGTAHVLGHDVREDPAPIRRLIGLATSNERSFYWRLTGMENLRFFATLYHVPPVEFRRWAGELLEALGLAEYAAQRFDTYSTGIRQRFAFARALLHRPRVLFMDEPTKGLDPAAADGLVRLIRERIVTAWRPTMILTSHNLNEIERLCDRVGVMRKGRLLRCAPLSELARDVRRDDRYRLTVSPLSAASLEALAAIRGVRALRRAGTNGTMDLEFELTGGAEALSAVLRNVLERGGRVHRCSVVDVSLADVFADLVTGEE